MATPILRWIAVGLGVSVLASAPGFSDILVLKDGSRVETKGPWETRGNVVVFHLPNGALSSLRADAVDLEVSRKATEDAKKPKPVKVEEPQKKPVLVLTDADVAHVDPEDLPAPGEMPNSPEGEETPPEATETPEEAAEEGALRVTQWEEVIPESGGGTTIRGTLRNSSGSLMTGIRVEVQALDSEGGVIGSRLAEVVAPTLTPGESTTFSANLAEVVSFTEVRFEVGSIPLQHSSPAPGTGEDEAGSEQPEA